MNGMQIKYFNENLVFFKCYFGKQVGCFWNKVYLELCENILLKNIVQMYIFEYVYDFVVCLVIGKDGNWLWLCYFIWCFGLCKGQFYIYFWDGLLKCFKCDVQVSEFYWFGECQKKFSFW